MEWNGLDRAIIGFAYLVPPPFLPSVKSIRVNTLHLVVRDIHNDRGVDHDAGGIAANLDIGPMDRGGLDASHEHESGGEADDDGVGSHVGRLFVAGGRCVLQRCRGWEIKCEQMWKWLRVYTGAPPLSLTTVDCSEMVMLQR